MHLIISVGMFFNDKIDAIRSTIGVTEPPYIPVREGANLDTFAVVSGDDVRKLVMKSKPTSCALGPMPTKLVKQYIAELLPFVTHIINLSIATGEFPQKLMTAFVVPLFKRQDWTPLKKTIVRYRISNMSLS